MNKTLLGLSCVVGLVLPLPAWAQELLIYDGETVALAPDSGSSSNVAEDASNGTAPSGPKSLRIDLEVGDWWAQAEFKFPTQRIDAYGQIEFDIKGIPEAPSSTVDVAIGFVWPTQGAGNFVRVNDFLPGLVGETYKHVAIPLDIGAWQNGANFTWDHASVSEIIFISGAAYNGGRAKQVIYIDNIKFTGTPSAPTSSEVLIFDGETVGLATDSGSSPNISEDPSNGAPSAPRSLKIDLNVLNWWAQAEFKFQPVQVETYAQVEFDVKGEPVAPATDLDVSIGFAWPSTWSESFVRLDGFTPGGVTGDLKHVTIPLNAAAWMNGPNYSWDHLTAGSMYFISGANRNSGWAKQVVYLDNIKFSKGASAGSPDAGSGDDGGNPPPDGGGTDVDGGSPPQDGGGAVDAGAETDGGGSSSPDGGTTDTDGSTSLDGGGAVDAGAETDGGGSSSPDGGTTDTDGSTSLDGGGAVDGGGSALDGGDGSGDSGGEVLDGASGPIDSGAGPIDAGGSAGGDASSGAGDAANPLDDGGAPGSQTGHASGCGCSTSGSPFSAVAAFALLVFWRAERRRKTGAA